MSLPSTSSTVKLSGSTSWAVFFFFFFFRFRGLCARLGSIIPSHSSSTTAPRAVGISSVKVHGLPRPRSGQFYSQLPARLRMV
ncbi:hypothetical protein CEP54_016223 [Fusarium duplospermum]|uniref:Uncharacterized protein n=1 Tax=Fusarium duplospermum TaxID=1325734 RepID=A0A428NGM9_9HYPO|nr:hypothetical protein CEP54_016223 [Fusarium duplospermum]